MRNAMPKRSLTDVLAYRSRRTTRFVDQPKWAPCGRSRWTCSSAPQGDQEPDRAHPSHDRSRALTQYTRPSWRAAPASQPVWQGAGSPRRTPLGSAVAAE